MTTALNVARRALRREPPPPPAETDHSLEIDVLLDVRTAIRALPRRQQVAVILYYLANFTTSEVAGAMGCREGTVRAHLAKARAALARSLGSAPRPAVTAHEQGETDA